MQSVPLSIYHHRTEVPCLNCPDRFIGCHSTCEKYKEWSKEDKKNQGEALSKKNEERMLVDVEIKSIKRFRRK